MINYNITTSRQWLYFFKKIVILILKKVNKIKNLLRIQLVHQAMNNNNTTTFATWSSLSFILWFRMTINLINHRKETSMNWTTPPTNPRISLLDCGIALVWSSCLCMTWKIEKSSEDGVLCVSTSLGAWSKQRTSAHKLTYSRNRTSRDAIAKAQRLTTESVLQITSY